MSKQAPHPLHFCQMMQHVWWRAVHVANIWAFSIKASDQNDPEHKSYSSYGLYLIKLFQISVDYWKENEITSFRWSHMSSSEAEIILNSTLNSSSNRLFTYKLMFSSFYCCLLWLFFIFMIRELQQTNKINLFNTEMFRFYDNEVSLGGIFEFTEHVNIHVR